MSVQLYSNELEKKRVDYFNKYGWSIGRDARIRDLMNAAFEEGQRSTQSNSSKETGSK